MACVPSVSLSVNITKAPHQPHTEASPDFGWTLLASDHCSERPHSGHSLFGRSRGRITANPPRWEGWGRIRIYASAGPCSILTICALNVERRISLPTRCSMATSWNTSGESLKAAMKGEASTGWTRSQKPDSPRRSGWALWFSNPTKQTAMSFARGKAVHYAIQWLESSTGLGLRHARGSPLRVILNSVYTQKYRRRELVESFPRSIQCAYSTK